MYTYNVHSQCSLTLTHLYNVHTITDSLTFVLGRWFEPHPDSMYRDNLHRPVCPGPLHINHCLWQYAVSPNSRRSLCDLDGSATQSFVNQSFLFGKTRVQQELRRQKELNAYFCLLTPSNIVERAHMTSLFLPGTAEPNSEWLQTVTLI